VKRRNFLGMQPSTLATCTLRDGETGPEDESGDLGQEMEIHADGENQMSVRWSERNAIMVGCSGMEGTGAAYGQMEERMTTMGQINSITCK